MEALPLLILAGLALSIMITFGNYELYCAVFFDERVKCVSSSITNNLLRINNTIKIITCQ